MNMNNQLLTHIYFTNGGIHYSYLTIIIMSTSTRFY